MEIANKKAKIADDQQSYNFIDRFPDIYDQIFGYLDHKSLLNAQLVCTSWNEFIGHSADLMMKTRVNFQKFPGTIDHYKIIKAWKRKIFHLRIRSHTPDDREVELLNKNASILQHLTSLDISAHKLNSIKQTLVSSLLLKNLIITCRESSTEDWNELAVGFEKINLKTLSILIWRKSFGVEKFLKNQAELEDKPGSILLD